MRRLLLLFGCGVWLWGAALCGAQTSANVAEQYLFQSANQERLSRGLPPLQWDPALQQAARRHAAEMAARRTISHQFSGEADLAQRAEAAGAHFSRVAENVAVASAVLPIHQGWMQSAHHRENLLDTVVDHVGIAVIARNGELFAVEDFDRGVETLSFDQQEAAVAGLLRRPAFTVIAGTDEARETCRMDTGFAGSRRPWFVMRFTASELSALPDELRTRLATGRFRSAQVGACPARDAGSFTGYSLAVLLFP